MSQATPAGALIPAGMIQRAIAVLLGEAPDGSTVILFGSYARGDADADSDLDFLVVEPTLTSRRAEMVRLRDALRPLGIPVDVLVVSSSVFTAWKSLPNNLIYEASREGKAYERAA